MEVEGSSRRPQQAVGEAGESSSNRRKRIRYILDDDSEEEPVLEAENDGSSSTGEEEEEEEDEEEEEEEEEEENDGSSSSGESEPHADGYDGDDAVEDQQNEQQSQQGGRGVQVQPPQPQEVMQVDSNDDEDYHMPIFCTKKIQGSTAPAPMPAPLSSSSCSDNSVVKDVTVSSGALDCGICFMPLKPPIFQCNVGHVVCSPCHDKLGVPRSCHVCRAPTPGGYQRCHAMEQLVDSIRVPCLHATHGCTDRPLYHNRESHAQACAHGPCHCPRLACGFVGSTAALLHHFAAVHKWPCTTEDKAGTGFDIKLSDGFNFVTAVRAGAKQGTTDKYLFLLNVARAPFGRTITAFCIHPHHTSTAELRLTYGCYVGFDMCSMHHQTSEFKVACTDLSNGLPDPSKCFTFIVPGSACRDDEEVTKVTATITGTPIQ